MTLQEFFQKYGRMPNTSEEINALDDFPTTMISTSRTSVRQVQAQVRHPEPHLPPQEPPRPDCLNGGVINSHLPVVN